MLFSLYILINLAHFGYLYLPLSSHSSVQLYDHLELIYLPFDSIIYIFICRRLFAYLFPYLLVSQKGRAVSVFRTCSFVKLRIFIILLIYLFVNLNIYPFIYLSNQCICIVSRELSH